MLVKGGLLVNERQTTRADLRIKSGRIAETGPNLLAAPGESIYDAADRLVLPGVIDSHTHFLLRARNSVTADDAFSGGVAAALGGVTTVIDYADLQAGESMVGSLVKRFDDFAPCPVDYSFHLVVNDHYRPEMAGQFQDLKAKGIASIKLFTTYREAGYMLAAGKESGVLAACRRAGVLVTVHAEADKVVIAATQAGIKAGRTGIAHHPQLRPAEAEAQAVRWLAELSAKTGCPVYIVHLSSAAGLSEVQRARHKGIGLLAETCPHYLLLDRSRLEGPEGANWLMTPPLREPADNEALWQGLIDGLIATIATDHCAFTPGQKAQGQDSLDTLPGIPGVEMLLPLIYTYGITQGRFDLPRLVQLLSYNPAQIFGLSGKGGLEPGQDADLVIYDPTGERILAGDDSFSRAGYNPFAGLTVKGRVEATILRGKIVAKNGEFYGQEGGGRFVAAR